MSTTPSPPFKIILAAPPFLDIKLYNLSLPASQQHPSIPRAITDAFSIREAVYVREQKLVALEHHINAEDGRSFHFVAYHPTSPQTPIGTLRLLPPPNRPRPENGSVIYTPAPGEVAPPSGEELFGRLMEEEVKRGEEEWVEWKKTDFWDGKEGFWQVGRVSVLKEWRGKGVADVLVQEAVRWAGKELGRIEKGEGRKEERRWKGLLLANAREEARRMWERNGFVEDRGLGRWTEVRVELFGVCRRVEMKEEEIEKEGWP